MIRKTLCLYKYPEYLKKVYYKFFLPVYLKLSGVSCLGRINIVGKPIITLNAHSRIILKENVTLCSDSKYTDLGVNHPVVLRTLRANAEIIIGSFTGISGGSFCAFSSIIIGNNCLIGANVTISDSDFHSLKPQNRRFNVNEEDIMTSPVVLEDNVFVGTGSIILKGVTVGENSVIGAGSVVTKNIPSNCIYAGNPAKLIKSLSVL
ncbi:MAG: DapH/DapD/GlmU-related protein [Pseudomonadota bacterium]|nr:DapH/DapD/GlmU-related protein [Pseudomonadota bacterium]